MPAIHGHDKTAEYWGLIWDEFLEATELQAQGLLVLPKIQVSPDLKDQEEPEIQPVTQALLPYASNRHF